MIRIFIVVVACAFLVIKQVASNCPTCSGFVPNVCLGTYSSSFSSSLTSYSTANAQADFALSCNSGNLVNTFIFQFSVSINGFYLILPNTEGGVKAVVQVNDCSGTVLGCDDNAHSGASQLKQVFVPGVQYLATVTKPTTSSASVELLLEMTIA